MALLLLPDCAGIPIKDSEWCGDVGTLGARCFNLLSTGQRKLSKQDWDAMRFGMVCTDGDALADLKGAIELLCSKVACDYQTKKDALELIQSDAALRATHHL